MSTVQIAGPETLINTTTTNDQAQPAITALSDGGYVITWRSHNPANNTYDIFAQRYAADGSRSGTETLINTTTAGNQSQPAITALSDGGYVVTWQGNPANDTYDIFAQRYAADGSRSGTETLINTTTFDNQFQSAITALSDGGYVVTWQGYNPFNGSGNNDIFAQRYAADGSKSGTETLINTTAANEQYAPAITALSDGGYVVTWWGYNKANFTNDIFAQRYAADGSKSGTETLINTTTTEYQYDPAITALSDGGYVVTWCGYNPDNGYNDIFAQRYAADGSKSGTETLINTSTVGRQFQPAITALSDGGYVVTWYGHNGANNTNDIFAQRYAADGSKSGTETLINTTTYSEEYEPAITALLNGSYVVTWQGYNTANGSWDIFSRTFGPADQHTLTGGNDAVSGTAGATLVITAPNDFGAGDTLRGGDGADTIELSASGRLDLTAPATLTGFETVLGASGEDTFVVSQAVLDYGVTAINGRGGSDTLTTAATALDLSSLSLTSIEQIVSTRAGGTAFTVGSLAQALLVEADGEGTSILAPGLTFTADQRAQIFANGVSAITDASGTWMVDTVAPSVPAVNATGPALVNGAGTLTVGQTLTLTLALSEVVDLTSAGPLTLSLSDGGTASLNAAASNQTRLVFQHTVQVDQVAADLAITAFNLNGASLTDAAGNALDLSGAVTNPAGVLRIDGYTGTSAAETFRGTPGAETFRGRGGNDTYVVGTAGDRVVEAASGGTDRVNAYVSYTLAAGQQIETLSTTSAAGTTAINLTGNELAQGVYGNAGANTLNGGAGADSLTGYGGDDLYWVDTAGDRVFEAGGQGSDTVTASVSYALTAGQSIEAMSIIPDAGTAAINLTGNELAQRIQGNAGANKLDGMGGSDTLSGYGGNDTYYVDVAGDKVYEAVGAGTDTVRASATFALSAGQEIELLATRSTATTNLTDLTGNAFAQTIQGNAVANRLDGRGGNDTLSGFDGRDAFVFSTPIGTGNRDRITDFSHLDDRFELSSSIFLGLPSGRIASTAFKDLGDTGAKVDSSDRVIYDHDTGVVSFDRDGSGTRYAAVQFAVLANKPTDVDYTDFSVVIV